MGRGNKYQIWGTSRPRSKEIRHQNEIGFSHGSGAQFAISLSPSTPQVPGYRSLYCYRWFETPSGFAVKTLCFLFPPEIR